MGSLHILVPWFLAWSYQKTNIFYVYIFLQALHVLINMKLSEVKKNKHRTS
jgi:hypothetical protein